MQYWGRLWTSRRQFHYYSYVTKTRAQYNSFNKDYNTKREMKTMHEPRIRHSPVYFQFVSLLEDWVWLYIQCILLWHGSQVPLSCLPVRELVLFFISSIRDTKRKYEFLSVRLSLCPFELSFSSACLLCFSAYLFFLLPYVASVCLLNTCLLVSFFYACSAVCLSCKSVFVSVWLYTKFTLQTFTQKLITYFYLST